MLFELGHHSSPALPKSPASEGSWRGFSVGERPGSVEIARQLRVDPAYLTRILRKFAGEGLTEAERIRPTGAGGFLCSRPGGKWHLQGFRRPPTGTRRG